MPCEQLGDHLLPEPLGCLEHVPTEGWSGNGEWEGGRKEKVEGRTGIEGEERERRVGGRRMEKQGCEHEGVQSRHKGDCDSVHYSFYKITSLPDTNWCTLTSTPVHLLVDPL